MYISNVRDADLYVVEKLNYFIDAPVELHILEVLWCLHVGPILDDKLTKDCYGNRLTDSLKKRTKFESVEGSHELFKRYIEQYNSWRDQGIDVANEIAKSGEDVALLSLDFKLYFYNIDVDFVEIRERISEELGASSPKLELVLRLTKIVELIFKVYNDKIHENVSKTHSGVDKNCSPPIGFASSSTIGNWYLNEFDREVADDVRPAYYGRYVDDVIMVFKKPKFESERPIESFVSQYLGRLVDKRDGDLDYSVVVGSSRLPFQKDKLILQYFDHRHSRAGLEVFKQELDERSSAFRFLPSDHIDKELDKFAYDILFDGSSNKLRSVVGLAENQTELSKYISNHITAHRLCKLEKQDVVLPGLKLLFKGVNALEFNRLWEKVYQYALITKEVDFLIYFYKYLCEEIEKVEVQSQGEKLDDLSLKIRQDLLFCNQASLSLTLALIRKSFDEFGDTEFSEEDWNGHLAKLVLDENMNEMVVNFRESNLIRHNLVAWPLANFTNYEGDLTDDTKFITNQTISIDESKISLSPRFIHYDEWQLFKLPSSLGGADQFANWHQNSHETYPNHDFIKELQFKRTIQDSDSDRVVIETLEVGEKETQSQIRIALANLCIEADDIEAAMRKDRSPNVEFKRQEDLYTILNSAVKENVDILVMPEVSIPVSWLPFVISHARKHQFGIVFGLEHWVNEEVVYNLTIEALPFKTKDKYRSCVITARLKNYYAPAELDFIDNLRMKPANKLPNHTHRYHKVIWKGINFATYNCYELADISHRSLFKSQLDILFACVWNRDTNYYAHILESAVRDLHCYLVQSNTSQYGGSCVLQPAKTEKAALLYVKGGKNASILTTDLDIASLRRFQYKSRPSDGDVFKHLPPGYDSESVLKR